MKKTKELDVEVRADSGTIVAIASSFMNKDRVNDVIMPGAFDEAIASINMKGLPMLFGHIQNDMSTIVGRWEKAYIDGDKVIVEGRFLDDEDGQRARKKALGGALSTVSVGMYIKDFEENEAGGINIRKAELVEVSLVVVPANPKAEVMSVKSAEASEPELEKPSALSQEIIKSKSAAFRALLKIKYGI